MTKLDILNNKRLHRLMGRQRDRVGNDWLRRKEQRERGVYWCNEGVFPKTEDVLRVKNSLQVTLWVDDTCGRCHFDHAYTFEEVMSFTFVGDVTVNGFSLWLGDREILWQRFGQFGQGITVLDGDHLSVDMKKLNLELLPFSLS